MAGILLVALIATLGIRNLVPVDALAPAIVTLLFAVGATTAGFALLCRRDRFRTMWFDLAGSLTFIGVVALRSDRAGPDRSGSSPFRINLSNGNSLSAV